MNVPASTHRLDDLSGRRIGVVPPIDPQILREVFSHWEPERPELLIRLRPRIAEAGRGAD